MNRKMPSAKNSFALCARHDCALRFFDPFLFNMTTTLRIAGSDGESQDQLEVIAGFEKKLDVLIREYFQRDIARSHARKRDRASAEQAFQEMEAEIRLLILRAHQELSESEKEKFVAIVQGRIEGLDFAKEAKLNKGRSDLRRKFSETVGGAAGGSAEAIEELTAQTKGPTARIAGHLAEFLTGVLREIGAGLWRGAFPSKKAA